MKTADRINESLRSINESSNTREVFCTKRLGRYLVQIFSTSNGHQFISVEEGGKELFLSSELTHKGAIDAANSVEKLTTESQYKEWIGDVEKYQIKK